ncbi:MAG: peptide-methionine (S)-S-oxide reductase MsrA [Saprospiraceae bacterium]|nr:peptide-methionine (S)-S-oxide reductase MsrA [Saprospiraceae bacterium]
MKNIIYFPLMFILISCSGNAQESIQGDMKVPKKINTEIATFGAGCFWCVEAVFQELQGVFKVESGYMGGSVKNPTYREICTGTTGHAEVAQITYDPQVISFEELLEVLWTTHDPTTLNRQGADRGTQYRSAVFYHNEEQRKLAEKSKANVATKIWDDPIVTEISEVSKFYVAEDYHQNYYKYNPNAGYCRVVINPKLTKLREKFADKLKS